MFGRGSQGQRAHDAVRVTPEPAPPGSGGWLRRMLPFLAAHRRNVAIALAASVLGQVAAAFGPLIKKVVVDDVLVGPGDGGRPLGPWLAALVGVALVAFVAAFLRRYVGGAVAFDVQYDLRNAVYERLQRLDFASHDQMQTGQLVSRSSTDVGMMQSLLAMLPMLLGNLVMVVVSLAVMAWLSIPLTLLVIATLPVMYVTANSMRRSMFPASWDAQQRAGEVAGVVDEAVTGVRVVKGFGQERRELDRLAARAGDLFASRVRLLGIQARFVPTLQAVPTLAQVGVVAFGGWLAIEGRISLGTFLAFSTYVVQLVGPVRMLATVMALGQQVRASAERLLDVLDANPTVVDRPDAPDLVVGSGRVRFHDVRFGYTASQPVLDGFDLTVEPGETVALVGPSGSGKSTVTVLLPRFYDVAAGAITIDGVDVRDVTMASLRRQVGVVFEESFLFSDTLAANIAYGRPDATDDEIRAAARAAEADRFIEALPEGYDTVVGERGLTLSGGQRQRVALARAILTDARILVLDDATSAVDAATEEEIHATLRRLTAGRTTLLVAHRLSTLRLADRIVVMDQGAVVATGTHEELVASSALYRALLVGEAEGLDGDRGEAPATNAAPTGDPWPYDRVAADALDVKASARVEQRSLGAGGGPGGPGGGAIGAALAPTPELLAALDRLPPATARPDVAVEDAAANDGPGFSLRGFLRRWRVALAIGLGLVVADTAVALLVPSLVRRAVDHGVRVGDTGVLWSVTAALVAVVAVGWCTTFGYTWVTGRTAERLLYALRVKVFAQLQRLSLDFYDRELGGRIMTRMTTDIESLSQLLQTGLINAVVSTCTGVGVLVFLVVLSPPLALAAAVVLPPLVVATWWFRRRSGAAYDTARDRIAAVNANLQESLSGVRVAQAFARQDRNIAGFHAVNRGYRDARLDAQRLIAIYFPLVLLLAELGAVAVLGASSAMVRNGTVTVGIVIAFLLYLDQFFAPIQQLSQVFDTWQQASVSLARIGELLDTPTGTPEPDAPHPAPDGPGAIDLRGVTFAYPGVAQPALRDLDLHVAAGETVALVGETGAGKSTVIKLIARFYDPAAGHIELDGVDVRTMALADLRRKIGLVPQEPFLFTGTVRDNIAYGRPDAPDEAIEAAARQVGAHEMIAGLADGYLTVVHERGGGLSAGQRQLIALARAELVDPPVLLLDEATSNLDLASEAKVLHAMAQVAARRTTVLVAHRLQTARTADRIVVLADGAVVESGTHDALVAQGGAYAGLWATFQAAGA